MAIAQFVTNQFCCLCYVMLCVSLGADQLFEIQMKSRNNLLISLVFLMYIKLCTYMRVHFCVHTKNFRGNIDRKSVV